MIPLVHDMYFKSGNNKKIIVIEMEKMKCQFLEDTART